MDLPAPSEADVEGGTAERDALLQAILPNIVFDGWTARAMRAGAEQAGYGAAALRRAFPDGPPDLLDAFHDWADRRMLAALAALEPPLGQRRVRDRIAEAVRIRLEILAPHREAVQRSLALTALPGFRRRSLGAARRTVDAIWRAAGDTATDLNHYTKRALLAAVLGSTVLFWLQDRSEGYAATWRFLDRRIAAVLAVGRTFGRLGGRLGPLAEAPWRAAAALRGRLVRDEA